MSGDCPKARRTGMEKLIVNEKRIPLKAFFEELEGRLDTCSADDLRSILRNMARAVPPDGRRRFLAQLEPGGEPEKAIAEALRQDDLLSDIDDLAAEIQNRMESAEEWEEEYGCHDRWNDEDSLGPYEEFLEPIAALFDRTAGVFDSGNLELSVKAYRRLLQLLGKQDDYGRGVGAEDLEAEELAEACARYLRAAYETTPIARRPGVIFEEMASIPRLTSNENQKLTDLIEITDRSLPDRHRFLQDWIKFLRKKESSTADRWLREAVRLSGGTEAMETLAREEGRKHPLAYVDWLASMNEEGRSRDVVAGAQEALSVLSDGLPVRAAIADELSAAAERLKDHSLLREARWQAFFAKPGLRRLVDLAATIASDAERKEYMLRAAGHLEKCLKSQARRSVSFGREFDTDPREQPAWTSESVLAHAWLLAGEWDQAWTLAKKEPVLGWSNPDTVQSLVVPAVLLASSGREPNIPANVKDLWESALERSAGWMTEVKGLELNALYEQAFADTGLSNAQMEKLLKWCRSVAEKHAEAIVRGKHRRSYGKAALLAAAVAETLNRREQEAEATKLIEKLRNQFPRHRAFQDELRAAESRMR